MKICLNCQKEYENKREASKYCSVKCRVAYNRKNPQNAITKVQAQVLYNEMLDLIQKAKLEPMQPTFGVVTKDEVKWGPTIGEPVEVVLNPSYTYDQLKQLITAATSSYDLEKAWKIVKSCDWVADWQMRELIRLKDLQQTKIDF